LKKIKFGAGFAIFIIFFGIATIDAIQSRDWLRVFFWLLTGTIFLVADNLKNPSSIK
jgi:hypothetical protein